MLSCDVIKIENLLADAHTFDIRWRVTTLCNYQCDFCIQGDRESHLRQSEGETAQLRGKICEEVIRLIEGLDGYDTVKVSLIGGELTILPDFPAILEKLALCRFGGNIRFDITTNFSQDTDYFCRLCDIIQKTAGQKQRSLFIGTSYYAAYSDKRMFAEKLRAVYDHAQLTPDPDGQEKRIRLSAGIPLLSDQDHGLLMELREMFKDTDVTIEPIFIRNYATSVSADTVHKLLVPRENGIRVTDRYGRISGYQNIQALGAALEDVDSFRPTGYVCDAGVRSVWIDAFGNAKRCPAIGSTMVMGNILQGRFHMLEGPQVCSSDHCSCSQYGRIEKHPFR